MHRFDRSPSQRYRFEQYFNYLQDNGIECELSYLISAKDDVILYKSGNFLRKFLVLAKSLIKRWKDVRRANNFDFIFIQREAFMTGTIIFEKWFSRANTKLIFDFDDSIWLQDMNQANKSLFFLKNPAKTAKIIKLCDLVVAGNQYLADYARQYNPHVRVIPTTIDTSWYHPVERIRQDEVCIGWSGSFSTLKHFELAIPALTRIKEKYGAKIRFKLIGDAGYQYPPLDIHGVTWHSSTEVTDLEDIDIGIMPLPDDQWSKGKCGLKGLQYMGMAIPTVMSPVGVNSEIVEDGKNGFLAGSEDEWVEKLSILIENTELRKEMGRKGRETVVRHYSVAANKQKYLDLFNRDVNK